MQPHRSAHTLEQLMAVLDSVFAGERDRSSAAAAPWWDRFYSDPDRTAPFLTTAPDENLVAWLDDSRLPARGRAIDLGCGTGRNAIYLAERGFTVDAVDLSPVAVDRALRLAEQSGVTINAAVGDVFSTGPPSPPYDLVHDSGLFHHLPPHRRLSYLTLLREILEPGGYFSLTCFGAITSHDEPSDVELYRTGDLGGGLFYPAEALRTIFDEYEEIELRPMHDHPAGSALFGKPFLWVALFRRGLG